jgi:hypothetical protein
LEDCEELIDGLTFDEWLNIIPADVENMTETELENAIQKANARVTTIKQKRTEKSWQADVYGKKEEYYSTSGHNSIMVAEPPYLYYSIEPTGTPEQDEVILKSIANRNAGGKFYTAEECKAHLKTAFDN